MGTRNRAQKQRKFWNKKYALTINNGNFFRGFVPCIPPKLRQVVMAKTQETHQSKNASEAAVWMITWWLGISQDALWYVNKFRVCEENRPGLGKQCWLEQKQKIRKDSTWTGVTFKAGVKERLHQDDSNVFVIEGTGLGWIEAFPAGYRTSQTMKIYTSQIFARFGIV